MPSSAAAPSWSLLPPLVDQAERLIRLGVAGPDPDLLRDAVRIGDGDGALLVVDAAVTSVSRLAPLLERDGRAGFVVADMDDVDAFAPVSEVAVPDTPYHLVHDVTRGDELADWSPDEAMPALAAAGRTPLTLLEGVHWVLQQPGVLERNRCFMTIGSRLRRPDGRFDARTPAIWISNGTGRDGRERRNAAKVGWCWWNNRHTWLGFASTTQRTALPT